MNNIGNKKIKKNIETIFKYVQNNKFYHKIKNLNLSIRIVLFLLLVIWFVVATVLMPPVPFGNISLILALMLFFPLGKIKSKTQYLLNKLRVGGMYGRWLVLKHKIKIKFRKRLKL